ncbi:MAG: phosphoglucosamine mutase [Castellaniella sp.]
MAEKQGERRYFGTDGIRGEVGGPLINAEFALRLGHAAGRVFAASHEGRGRPAVLIGKDTRISGYMLESAMEAGFSAAGIDVLLAGPLPTPAIAYLTRTLRLMAGVVISASHNPFQDNGIKFFSGGGTKLPDVTELEIEHHLDQPVSCVESRLLGRARRLEDAAGRYIEFCKSTFPNEMNLLGLRLVVDAAHGAAYHIAPHVFRELGAEVHALACEPDGFNINDGVGATHPEALVAAVREQGADLGIALDGDADRLQMVDATGRLFNGDELLYAIVRDRMSQGPVGGVVGTLMSNFGLERRLQALGLPFERAAVGDRHVLERLQERGWLLGGESSGHLLCLDRHTTGDGIIAALQVLTAMKRHGKTLASLVSDLHMATQLMINVPLRAGVDWRAHSGLQKACTEVDALLGTQGRVLIRPSGTEPKLRLMVEADDAALAQAGMDRLAAVEF